MKLLILSALVVVATASYNYLGDKGFAGFGSYYYPVGKHTINPYCDAVGRYLPHPTDRCRYLRCDYGDEPWYDSYGRLRYYALPFTCPAGTAVRPDRYPAQNAYGSAYSPAYGPHEYPCEPEEGVTCPASRD